MLNWVIEFLRETDGPHTKNDDYAFAEWVVHGKHAHDYCTSNGFPWVDEWDDRYWEEAYMDLRGQYEIWYERAAKKVADDGGS